MRGSQPTGGSEDRAVGPQPKECEWLLEAGRHLSANSWQGTRDLNTTIASN